MGSITTSASKIKVLISGAGIAGPCLAYWLSRTRLNCHITIVERSPSPRVTGQSVDIRGPAIEIIKKMKLEEAVRSRTTTEEGTIILNSKGKAFAHFMADGTFTAEYEILRGDLAGLFMEATQDPSNVKYTYNDSIKSLFQTEKNIDVTFTGGSKETFDLVVAADGSTSKTRPMILDSQTTKDSYNFLGQYIAYFSIPRAPHDEKLWKWYNVPKGLAIMTRPHRNPSTMGAYLCVTTPSKSTRDPAFEDVLDNRTVEDTKRLLHTYFDNIGWEGPRVLSGMDTSQDFYMSRAAQVKQPRWTNNRACVIGDAAVATFGVGTSLAIESAYYLAGEISKIKGSEDIPRALERYEQAFRPLYTKMEDLPPGFPQVAFPQTSWGLWLRDCGLWLVSKTKLYKWFGEDDGSNWKLPEYDWKEI